MTDDNSSNKKTPNGSTEVSESEKARVESLPDGSQSDGTAETDEDTVSGGPAN